MNRLVAALLVTAAAFGADQGTSEAVAGLVGEITSDDDQAHIVTYLDALTAFNLPAADRALTSLLSDPRPFVRGEAAIRLGRRKCRCAVTALTNLLGDPSVFYTQLDRRGPPDEASVGAAARMALRRITGVPHGVESDAYAFLPSAHLKPLYQKWWVTRSPSFVCK